MTDRRAPWWSYLLTVLVGGGLAVVVGLIARAVRVDEGWGSAIVFAAMTAGPLLALAWLVLVSRHTVPEDPHAEDSVERAWMTRATSGALLDVVVLAGVALAAISILDTDIAARTVMAVVLVTAMGDTAVRYLVLRARG